jgi:membrane fusion protein (multidrug efflux system)
MEQIYEKEGIPTKIKTLKSEEFVLELPFSASLSGKRQSYASALIGGRIEKVLVEVGDYVKQDQVIIEFPEDAPAAQFQQAKSAYEMAQTTYQRMNKLYEAGGISKQELDQAETQMLVNKANYDAASQMLKVRAPISGIVTSVNVRETDGVEAKDILAIISNTKELKSTIWTTEKEICQIKVGQKARAVWQGNTIWGKVTEVANSMDPTHRAFQVDLLFENQEKLCKSGVTADIFLQTYVNPQALVVPRKVIKNDIDGSYLYVVEDGKAVKRYVQTGVASNGDFEITSGLKAGEKIITEGLNLIYNGAKVKLVD